jgi:hypothetical protein
MDESLVPARHLLAKAWLLLSRALAAGSVPPWQCHQGAWDQTWRRGLLSRCFPDAAEDKHALAAASFLLDKQGASGDAQDMQGARMMLEARRKAVSLMKEVVEADGGNCEARLLVTPQATGMQSRFSLVLPASPPMPQAHKSASLDLPEAPVPAEESELSNPVVAANPALTLGCCARCCLAMTASLLAHRHAAPPACKHHLSCSLTLLLSCSLALRFKAHLIRRATHARLQWLS